MKIIKLKDKFITQATKADSEFIQKVRPCISLTIYSSSKDYIVPISNSKHDYCFELSSESRRMYINFEKAFPLVNDSIVAGDFRLKEKDRWVAKTLRTQKKAIERSFNNYIKNHPADFSPNQEILIRIQQEYSD